MTDRPGISVIVPFFDNEGHIAACLESLLEQRGMKGSFELLFIDNGSRDGSAAIVENYRRHPELIVLSERTPGAYAARNAGLRKARAPIIAFTDADCLVAPDWLQSIQDGMEDSSIGILLGRCRYPNEASLALRALAAYENAKTEYVVERCSPAFRFAYANNMAVRSSIFEMLGSFKEWKRAADSELVHRVSSQRPELRLAYRPSMQITHMEFLRVRDRARRLSLYTKTNSKIASFRELRLVDRIGVLAHLLRGSRAIG